MGHRKSEQINILQIIIGFAALIFGTLVYFSDRISDHVYFIRYFDLNLQFFKDFPPIFGEINHSLPDFIHTFSFIMITAGITGYGKGKYLFICLFWLCVDCVFEFGQKYSQQLVGYIPTWFASIPFLENTRPFLQKGTFDIYDIIAFMAGTITAYYILIKTAKTGSHKA